MDMRFLLAQQWPVSSKTMGFLILGTLAASCLCLFSAPWLMPPDYTWQSNAVSESAAQGVEGAWLARLGFILYGLAVMGLVVALKGYWNAGARFCHVFFGVFMIMAAAFSIRPWHPDAAFDATEDFLHSFVATAMGFAYTFGVILVFLQRAKSDTAGRMFDLIAAVVATLFPLLMLALPDLHGFIQRLMFMVSYIWYAKETVTLNLKT